MDEAAESSLVSVAFPSDALLPPEVPSEDEDEEEEEEEEEEEGEEDAESFVPAAEFSLPWQAVSESPAARARAARVIF